MERIIKVRNTLVCLMEQPKAGGHGINAAIGILAVAAILLTMWVTR